METLILRLGPELSRNVKHVSNKNGWLKSNLNFSISMSMESKLAISHATELLKNGDLVAIPTETVYGLAADATSKLATSKIYTAKNRPSDNPLIVHVSSLKMLRSFLISVRNFNDYNAELWPPVYDDLMATFWPGPLTLLFKTSNDESVAIRMPAHSGTLALIESCDFPLAAPSANLSGRPSPTDAQNVFDDLNGRIPLILDGGRCSEGLESTVFSCLEDPLILRPGTVTLESIRSIPGLENTQIDGICDENSVPKAPGMKYKHYSPNSELHLVENTDINEYICKLSCTQKIGVLWTSKSSFESKNIVEYVVENAARELFRGILWLDKQPGLSIIVVQGVPDEGVGTAIMNRVRKAATVVV